MLSMIEMIHGGTTCFVSPPTAAAVLSSVFALPTTGMVATSGVVAIVLALALQNTLADVFAGMQGAAEASSPGLSLCSAMSGTRCKWNETDCVERPPLAQAGNITRRPLGVGAGDL
jgi:hypothetical protein